MRNTAPKDAAELEALETREWLDSLDYEALGVDQRAYLWAPAWTTVALAYLVVAAVFALGMIGGGVVVCRSLGMTEPWELLTAELVAPRPERAKYTARAIFLVWMYAWGIASDVVAKGSAPKPDADAVTRGMTASVVSCTLWVVALELLTVVWVLR